MTVQELMEKLKTYPSDMPVVISSFPNLDINDESDPVIRVCEEYPFGDPANPECEFRKALLIGW